MDVNYFSVVILFFIAFQLAIIWIGCMWFMAKFFNIQALEIDIFKGKSIGTITIDGVVVRFKTLPYTSSIKFLHTDDLKPDAKNRMSRRPGFQCIDEAPYYQHMLVAFSGCLGGAVLAAIIIGDKGAFHHMYYGLWHIYDGGVHPCLSGRHYLQAFFEVCSRSILVALAILCAKQVAFNLVPYAGGPVYFAVSIPIVKRLGGGTAEAIFRNIGFVILLSVLLLLMGWALALAVYSVPALSAAICDG